MVQELWDLLQPEEPELSVDEEVGDHVFLALSQCAINGTPSPKTVRLIGAIQGFAVTVLLDSGSSTSFITGSFASQLPHIHTVPFQYGQSCWWWFVAELCYHTQSPVECWSMHFPFGYAGSSTECF